MTIIQERSANWGSAGGKSFTACVNICTDRQNNIWLLTETNVYRYDRVKQQFSLLPTPNNEEPVVFTDIIEDKSGDYWLSTWRDGLYRYKIKEKSFRKFTEKDHIYANSATALINDPVDNAVWIGTFNTGAYRYGSAKR